MISGRFFDKTLKVDWLFLGLTLALMVSGPLLARPMLKLLNTPDSILNWCQSYLSILFLGALGGGIYNILSGVLRGLGDSISALIYLLVAVGSNIVLDFLFVAYLGMGVSGVAWATVLAQLISAVLCLVHIVAGVHVHIIH